MTVNSAKLAAIAPTALVNPRRINQQLAEISDFVMGICFDADNVSLTFEKGHLKMTVVLKPRADTHMTLLVLERATYPGIAFTHLNTKPVLRSTCRRAVTCLIEPTVEEA